MKISFHGAAGTTTGSQHLIEVNGQRILLDCGLYQGRRDDAYQRNLHFPFEAASLDAVVLSHAHIDHSGNLPNLVKQGFRGNIYATDATRDLCTIMLRDSAHIQQSDLNWLNKKRAKIGKAPLSPMYDERDAELTLRQFVTINYHRPIYIAKGVQLQFIDAGHILGSAQVILDIDDESTGQHRRLLFSGDVGRPNNALLNSAEPCDDIDLLILESTYGGRHHEHPVSSSDQICDVINRTVARDGKVLIPAFAVERTQQLLFELHELMVKGCFPPIQIYVDSPLAVGATEIFRLHPECFNEKVYDKLFEKQNPFGFDGLHLIRQVDASKRLNDLEQPAIIIAASGMCESGRILHHLRNNIEDERNTVLFVGYCAEHTLGWKLRSGAKKVSILGDEFAVKAPIEIMDSFSGHADHQELLDYDSAVKGPKTQTFLVHGEPEGAEALRSALVEREPQRQVSIAKLHQSVEV